MMIIKRHKKVKIVSIEEINRIKEQFTSLKYTKALLKAFLCSKKPVSTNTSKISTDGRINHG